jgi:hypothetical protein
MSEKVTKSKKACPSCGCSGARLVPFGACRVRGCSSCKRPVLAWQCKVCNYVEAVKTEERR